MCIPDRETIIKLVKDTMTLYGSDAGERKRPGSKLQAQAEHIADVLEQYEAALDATANMSNIEVKVRT